MTASGIVSFFACRACTSAHRRSKLHVGLTDPMTVRVWCATCNSKVVDLTLDEAMPLRCDVCGEQITERHHRH